MEEIIFGFSTPKCQNPISWAIRKLEGTEYSHVYMRTYSHSLDRWLVYHASHSSVHFSSWIEIQKENKIIREYKILVTDEQKRQILTSCIDMLDIHYGRLQLVGMMLSRLAKIWFNLNIKNPFADGSKTEVCSELQFQVLEILGLIFPSWKMESLGPRYFEKCISVISIP